MALQVRSVEAPLDSPGAASAAIETLKAMEAMGLLEEDVEELTLPVMRRVARRAARAGIGESAAASLQRRSVSAGDVADLLRELQASLEASPAPEFEWPSMIAIFGVDELADLVGVARASLRRYAAGTRPTPDVVAARLHLLALVVGELRGAYTEVGARRWFERRRPQLGGRSPGQLLAGDWDPDGDGAASVLALARSLGSSPVT